MRLTLSSGILGYGAAGAIGTIAHYATLYCLVQFLRAEPVLGSTIGAIAGAAINYGLNYRYIFRSGNAHRRALPRFMLVAATGLLANALVLFGAVHVLRLHYLLGQVIATALIFLATYELNRRWTF